MGGMGGMGKKKKATKSRADIEREAKAEQERLARQLAAKLAGGDAPAEETKKDEGSEDQGPPGKEIVKGYRWVAITGTLDHEKMRANYREALKNPAVAHPNYLRLDLQRQTLQTDGTWTEWQNVDAEANLRVLDNLPEEDEELTPESVRPKNLVNPLPFLKAGLWEKVHIASLVPKEKKEIPKSQPGMMMGGGMRRHVEQLIRHDAADDGRRRRPWQHQRRHGRHDEENAEQNGWTRHGRHDGR